MAAAAVQRGEHGSTRASLDKGGSGWLVFPFKLIEGTGSPPLCAQTAGLGPAASTTCALGVGGRVEVTEAKDSGLFCVGSRLEADTGGVGAAHQPSHLGPASPVWIPATFSPSPPPPRRACLGGEGPS